LTWLNSVRLQAQPAGKISQQKAVRVLSIARQAARNQMQDLSLRSVREALGKGTPIPAMTDSKGEQLSQEEAGQQLINTIESELRIITELWQQQQMDPIAVWDTLRDVVIPDRRPEEIFVYQRMAASDTLTMDLFDRSVGSLLIRQAIVVGRAEELRRILETRLAKPECQSDSWLLLLQLAIEGSNFAEARNCLGRFSGELIATSKPPDQLLIAITLLRAWSIPPLKNALVPVMDSCVTRALDTAADAKMDKAAVCLAMILARNALHNGKFDVGLRHLGQADVLVNRQIGSTESPLAEHYVQAATLLLQFGLEQPAMARLVEVSSMTREPGSRSSQTISRAALLTRSFRHLLPQDRYAFLRQCLLVNNRSALLNPAVEFPCREQPPEEFLEPLPEPVRPSAFLDAGLETGTSLASSVWELVDAAHEAGESNSLRTEFLKLQKENHRAGSHLLVLFFLRNEIIDEAVVALREIRNELQQDPRPNGSGRVHSFDLLVALKASELPQTRPLAIEILEILRRLDIPQVAGPIAAHASAGRARALALRIDTDSGQLFEAASPAVWLPATNSTLTGLTQRSPRPLWLVHDGVISYQAGTENDSLYFPWPLGGTFEFSVSSLDDVQQNGDLGFDGLTCEIFSRSASMTVSGLGTDNPFKRPLRFSQSGTYVRKSVSVTPTQLTFLVNGHPVFSEQRTAYSSPWLSLFARGDGVGLWRFPEMTGSPEILPEVTLSKDPQMRGWSCSFLGQTRSRVAPVEPIVKERPSVDSELRKSFDWAWEDGIITGRHLRDTRRLDAMMDESLQGLLRYDRPLASGETLTWDFDYSPGKVEAHPALGRMAFLFYPDGVSLHWITVDAGEWNLLPADHGLTVRKDQRGPAKLPLHHGWNQAAMSLQRDTVSLSINGVLVYEHTLRQEDRRQFGLFHFRTRTTARVRNIVLSGDWPKSLTAEDWTALTQSRATSLTAGEQHVLDRILDEEAFSTDVVDVVRFANQLTPESRFEFLLDWVVPGNNHPDWRMFGDLAPSDAAALAVSTSDSNPLGQSAENTNSIRESTGGYVISPAIQLVRSALEVGRVAALQSRIDTTPDSGANDQRAKLALQILLAIDDSRTANAVPLIQEMSRLTRSMIHFSDSQVWPEMMVAQQTMKESQLRPHAIGMLRHIVSLPRADTQPISSSTARSLHAMIAKGELLQRENNEGPAVTELSRWQPFRITRADLRNDGLPLPLWIQTQDGSIQHVSGFEDDMLCWPVPLRGDFEFECELLPVDGEHLLVGYGGFFIKPTAQRNAFQRIPVGRDATILTTAEPVDDQNAVWSYRLVVSQGQAEVFVNGKRLTIDAITADAPPWLCIRAASRSGAVIRKIRLTGQPTISGSFELSTGRDLDGWCRPYFGGGEPFVPRRMATSDWRSEESVIVGSYRSTFAGSRFESLLQYFRPLMEDGSITYQFLYEPGVAHAHPALDRLAFLLDKRRGVLIHKITNGADERSGLDPANAVAESQHQLVTSLPLLEKDWNVMQLRLEGDTITLVLNDTEIFRRPLERTNHRTFGIFHFRDETSARVRNLSWQGNWPRTLPE
jgi:hypothetical protein